MAEQNQTQSILLAIVGEQMTLVLVEVEHESTEVDLSDKDFSVSFILVFQVGFLKLLR